MTSGGCSAGGGVGASVGVGGVGVGVDIGPPLPPLPWIGVGSGVFVAVGVGVGVRVGVAVGATVGTGVGVAVGNGVDVAVGAGIGVTVGLAGGVGVGVGSGNDVGVAAGLTVEVGEGIAVSLGATVAVAVLMDRAATTAVDTPGGGIIVTVIGVGVAAEIGVASALAGGSAVDRADVGEGVDVPKEGAGVVSACAVMQAVVSIAIAPTTMIALNRFVSLCHISRGNPSAFATLTGQYLLLRVIRLHTFQNNTHGAEIPDFWVGKWCGMLNPIASPACRSAKSSPLSQRLTKVCDMAIRGFQCKPQTSPHVVWDLHSNCWDEVWRAAEHVVALFEITYPRRRGSRAGLDRVKQICSHYSVTPSSRSRFSPCGPRSTPR